MSLLSMPTTGSIATTPADKEESEDLFSAHDFDVQIDMALPGGWNFVSTQNYVSFISLYYLNGSKFFKIS